MEEKLCIQATTLKEINDAIDATGYVTIKLVGVPSDAERYIVAKKSLAKIAADVRNVDGTTEPIIVANLALRILGAKNSKKLATPIIELFSNILDTPDIELYGEFEGIDVPTIELIYTTLDRPTIGLYGEFNRLGSPTVELIYTTLDTPDIGLYGEFERVDTPTIELVYNTLDTPTIEIYGEFERLDVPVIELIYNTLDRPIVELHKEFIRLDSPTVELIYTTLDRPTIELYGEFDRLDRPTIELFHNTLDTPDIELSGEFERVNTPVIEIFDNTLGRPIIELYGEFDRVGEPTIYLFKEVTDGYLIEVNGRYVLPATTNEKYRSFAVWVKWSETDTVTGNVTYHYNTLAEETDTIVNKDYVIQISNVLLNGNEANITINVEGYGTWSEYLGETTYQNSECKIVEARVIGVDVCMPAIPKLATPTIYMDDLEK